MMLFHIYVQGQNIGSFIDDRDNQVYVTVSYIVKDSDQNETTMTWMAENLNFKMENSYCYDDYESNCEIMGRLYKWSSAINACPEGWHLPNDEDWYALANLYGGVAKAAIHLKSTDESWARDGHGTNKSLFNAMPYGNAVIGNGYYSYKQNALFWSSSEKNEEYAWDWNMVSIWDKIKRSEGNKEAILNSVRCVKD